MRIDPTATDNSSALEITVTVPYTSVDGGENIAAISSNSCIEGKHISVDTSKVILRIH